MGGCGWVHVYFSLRAFFTMLTCPQLIDPSVDFLAFMLLARMKGSPQLHPGMKSAHSLLMRQRRPLVLIITTETLAGLSGMGQLHDLLTAAAARKVPVVHALSRATLAFACGMRKPLTVVTVMDTADEETRRLMSAMLAKASVAYEGYVRLVFGAKPEFVELDSDEDLIKAGMCELSLS